MSAHVVSSKSAAADAVAFATAYCAVPEKVRHDPYRVALLGADAERLLLGALSMTPSEAWIAEIAGAAMGRVAVNLSPTRPGIAYLGFFDVSLEHPEHAAVAAELLARACEFARSKGATDVYGPVDICTWFPYRLRTDEGPPAPFDWEPVNPPDYVRLFTNNGFKEESSYYTVGYGELGRVAERCKRGYDVSLANGFSYRPMRVDDALEAELELVYRLSLASFTENVLFEPLPYAVFAPLLRASLAKRKLLGAFFALDENGDECGFMYNFESRGHYVMKTMAVLPEHAGRGLGGLLFYLSTIDAMERGYTEAIAALIQSKNRSGSYPSRGTELWQHHYSLYRRTL